MESGSQFEEFAYSEAPPVTQYFNGQMPPVQISFGYRLGLILVTFGMVLLPLIYLAFVGCICWGLYLWAVHAAHWFFPEVRGTRHIFLLLVVVYLAPLLAGFILVLFMIKSFFSSWRGVDISASLSHEDHPELFRFLGQLCQQVGAPIPSRIDVNLDINAGAGLREGFSSFFGNDICLVIGLPLVAGITCKEFAGIMAHELGHFTQRAAMRCNFIITKINNWLLRTVYTRDDFDASLDEAGTESVVGLIIWVISSIGIGITRGLAWVLLLFSHAISSYMMRQMEFHADACEVAVSGTEGFVSASRKFLVLNACSEQARVQIRNQVSPKYPDDLSTYIAILAAQCAGQTQGKLFESVAKRKTRWFLSHPSDADRVARARLAAQPGIIHDERPATVLFNDFAKLSRDLTLTTYLLQRRGKPLSQDQLFSVEQPAAEAAPDTREAEANIQEYFSGLGFFLRPIMLGPEFRPGLGLAAEKMALLNSAKETLRSSDLSALCESAKQLDSTKVQALGALSFIQAGVAYAPESFPLIPAEGTDVSVVLQSLRNQEQDLNARFERFDAAAKSRLLTSLSYLRTPAISAAIPNTQQLQDQVQDWMHAFGKVSATFPALLSSREEIVKLNTLLQLRGQTNSEFLDAAINETVTRSRQLLDDIQHTLGSTAYPLPHPRGRISISDYARCKEFNADPAQMMQLELQSHLQALFALYYRLLDGLIGIARQVEQQLSATPPAASVTQS